LIQESYEGKANVLGSTAEYKTRGEVPGETRRRKVHREEDMLENKKALKRKSPQENSVQIEGY